LRVDACCGKANPVISYTMAAWAMLQKCGTTR
jgi:hypothetical protein